MQVEDLIVEVRDENLQRQWQIDAQFLTGATFAPKTNGVGTWQVVLPATVDGAEYEPCTALRAEGAGIIVTTPQGVLISGPTDYESCEQTSEDPDGTWTIQGWSDDILLDDALAYPDPETVDVSAQTKANDVRTDTVEDLLIAYVSANIGPDAPSARTTGTFWASVVVGTSLGRGPTRTASPRFQNLLQLCQELVADTNVLFRLVQNDDDELELEISLSVDRSGEWRFDIDNEQLQSTQHGSGAPSVTRAIVAGQEQGVNRTIIERTSTASLAAEAAWKRRRERFVDQRQTDDTDELEQAGDAVLAEGAAPAGFTVEPSENIDVLSARSALGSLVSITIGDTPVTARLNQVILTITENGVYTAAVIGDDDGTDWEGRVNRSLESLTSRVSNLERNDPSQAWTPFAPVVAGVTSPSVLSGSYLIQGNLLTYHFEIVLDSGSGTSSDWVSITHPVEVSPTDMPAGKSAIGTAVWSDGSIRKQLAVLRRSVSQTYFAAGPGDVADATRLMKGTDLAAGDVISGTVTVRI
jgi:hypothetical protein